jgi:hypothetical protein
LSFSSAVDKKQLLLFFFFFDTAGTLQLRRHFNFHGRGCDSEQQQLSTIGDRNEGEQLLGSYFVGQKRTFAAAGRRGKRERDRAAAAR